MTSVGRCASCGAGLGPGARFCRDCGAAVEATEVGAGSPDAVDGAARSCPSCSAPVLAGASFCRSCGGRLGAGEPPVAPPPPPPPGQVESPPRPAQPSPHPSSPPPSRRGRGPLIAVAAFLACLLLGGLVGGGVYLLTRDGSEDEPIVVGPIADPPPPPGPGGGDGGGDPDNHDRSGGTSPLLPGRYIQAGSFRSPEGAGREVDRLVGEGIDVEAVPADWASELLPGFQVLLVGPLATSGEEGQALRQLEDASVAGFGRDLTPSRELPGPAAAAGSWSGDLEQSYLRGARAPETYPVEFTLDPDGESGTVDYPGRGCHGSLTLNEESDFSLAYSELIESGGCRAGGVWHLRPDGAGITAVRLYEDLDVQVMVAGKATALGG